MSTNYSVDNERELLLKVAQADERAFGRLVRIYWQAVYNHALTYLKSPQLAEETALDVFEKLWRKRELLPQVENFKDWLFILGRNEFISRLRKKLDNPPQPGTAAWWIEEVHIPGQSLELKELARWIEMGIEKLTPHQKEIFTLSREQGLTHEQIALQLGISRHTVKGHMVNALNFLRTYLKTNTGISVSIIAITVMMYRP